MAFSGEMARAYDIGFTDGLKQGRTEGRHGVKVELLTWLEAKYMAKDVKRGTPKAEAILQLAQEISQEFKPE